MAEIMAASQAGALSDAEPNTVGAHFSHSLVSTSWVTFFPFSWNTGLPESSK